MARKIMRSISEKTSLLALTMMAVASLSGVLTACSNPSQNNSTTSPNQSEGQNAAVTNTNSNQNIDNSSAVHHSHTDHSMAMNLGPADIDYDLRFIDGMILHHQGAVEMAKEAQQKSTRPQIKKLAEDIIKDQNKEIDRMKQWRKAWYPNAADKPMAYDAAIGKMTEMSSDQKKNMMMDMDLGAANGEFDLRFVNAMIPHHEGAVTMAQDALTKSKRAEIKQLSQAIVKAQAAEIKQMKQWRQTWYKQ
ncbi:DUF305 domain-containing protein [Aerosakkonema sp. BLCC-F183]|uniref:DUF305 domain-containing protein n=1 Tax=Aerosakkonema sp. BLCC-F183 TaxID=3342834 RepID=UPI0035B81466